MIAALKFLHLGAIAVWAGGLIVLPLLLARRRDGLAGEPLHELHRLVRRLYVGWMSPAAALAIASGAALIVARQTYEPWFTAKLAAVGLMAMLHVVQGLFVPRVFAGTRRLPPVAARTLMGLHVAVVLAVLTLVLAKPQWQGLGEGPEWLAPGALGARWGDAAAPWLDGAREALGRTPNR